jgi:protein-disulfide isomerase
MQMLQIGMRIDQVAELLQAAGHLPVASLTGRRAVLIVLPPISLEAVENAVERYRQNREGFEEQAAALIELVAAHAEGLPAVLVIDENGTVRQVYDGERYPSLPNPAAVLRALRRLNDAPRPAPVDPDDWQAGPPDAGVVLIEYSDYECKHCRDLHRALHDLPPGLLARTLRVHRHLPLRGAHPLAQLAAEAAEAAGAQGRFWEMHDRLFRSAGDLAQPSLLRYAAELDLDLERFADELGRRVHENAVNEDLRRAAAGRIKLPPSLFINGALFEGDRSPGGLAVAFPRCWRSSGVSRPPREQEFKM